MLSPCRSSALRTKQANIALMKTNKRTRAPRVLHLRKFRLQKTIPAGLRVLYSDHIERRGIELFELVCQHDMEGVVGKWEHGVYDQPSWVKIKNPKYSQVAGRREKFEARERAISSVGRLAPSK